MKTAEYLRDEILKLRPTYEGPSEYGDRVMPVLATYQSLESFEERKAFQDALELLLKSNVEDERRYAVDICLGFFIFRDAI